jgi:hypothetical protein
MGGKSRRFGKAGVLRALGSQAVQGTSVDRDCEGDRGSGSRERRRRPDERNQIRRDDAAMGQDDISSKKLSAPDRMSKAVGCLNGRGRSRPAGS